jgi:hypothetical protein
VTVDPEMSGGVLPKGGFIAGREDGFGIFERWILRLGYFTRRASVKDAAGSRMVVVINPNRPVPLEYVAALTDYVKGGGNLLVLDSQKNATSTADSLLWPFKLSVNHSANLAGPVAGPPGWPAVKTEFACEVTGGQAFAHIEGKPVAATARFGDGSATVIGFSHRFCDVQMGVTGDTVPDAAMRDVYEMEYKLLRAIAEQKPPIAPAVITSP